MALIVDDAPPTLFRFAFSDGTRASDALTATPQARRRWSITLCLAALVAVTVRALALLA